MSLTKRQREVLALLKTGKSDKEIARDLNAAVPTIKVHVSAILRTMGVRNRTQAAVMASIGVPI